MKNKTNLSPLENSRYAKDVFSPGLLFWRAYQLWQRKIKQALEIYGITQVQYAIMAAIGYHTPTQKHITQQFVAEQLSMDKMMVSDVVKLLKEKKLLTKKAHPDDGRAFTLDLTREAKNILKKAVIAVESADEEYFSAIKKSDQSAFLESLISLNEKNQFKE